jgi:hypothetical protein
MGTASVYEASARVIVALGAAGRSRTTITRHEAELNAFARFLQARGQDLPTEADCLDCAGVLQAPLPVHGVRLVVAGGLPAPVLPAARRDHVPGAALPRPALAARRPGGRDAPGRHTPAGSHGGLAP